METGFTEFESIKLRSSIDNIVQVESYVDQVCQSLDISEDNYGNVLIAVIEAVNNAIKHGNKEDLNKEVEISLNELVDRVQFFVKDEGDGFDYENLPDPTSPENLEKEHGRGVFLMKTLSDEINFEDNGRCVVITFNK